MRAVDPRLEFSDQAMEGVSPPVWSSLLGASSPLRSTPIPTQHPEELYP